MGSVACKDENQNEVEALEAEEAAVAAVEAVPFEIDPTASTIEWRGTKPTGEHIGTIGIQEGVIMANDEEIAGGKVTVDMNSITVLDEGMAPEDRESLANHLKGTVEGKETDFFNVQEFPVAVFEITGVSEVNGENMLQGNLTIKNETKNIEIPVTTSISGDELTLQSETFTIDRTDWGVNYGSKSIFDDLGDNFISDDMELKIAVTARRAE